MRDLDCMVVSGYKKELFLKKIEIVEIRLPRLIVYSTNRANTTRITNAFAQGASLVDSKWEVEHCPIDNYKTYGIDKTMIPGTDAVCALGILRGSGMMLKEAARKGIDYFYMDHAYYDPGYDGNGWMRITKNGHSCNTLRTCSPKAFKSFKNIKNNYWQSNDQRGDKIVICPPTHAVAWYAGLSENWADQVAKQLCKMLPSEEHNRIHIRNKPKDPVVNDNGELLGFKITEQQGSLEQDLIDAHCVIAYNSMVALKATLMGIPVIVSDMSCFKSVSFSLQDFARTGMPKIFDKEPKNRMNMLYWLAKNQWKFCDIASGKAWKELQFI